MTSQAETMTSGTCGCCGRTFKTRNGRLSNHGYTVRYGWHMGNCIGSKLLALEISDETLVALRDAMVAALARARAFLADKGIALDSESYWVLNHWNPADMVGTRGVRDARNFAYGQIQISKTFEKEIADIEARIAAYAPTAH